MPYMLDRTSLSSTDWRNAGMPVTYSQHQVVPKVGGGEEMFYQGPYPNGLSSEYAGLWEVMVDGFSIRYNFRYAHLLPKTRGNGASLYVGNRVDTGGLQVQSVGSLRVDAQNNYVIDPETGQPYIDGETVEFTARTWRNEAIGGQGSGGMRFICRGTGNSFEWKSGPKTNEVSVMRANAAEGLVVRGVNIEQRLSALEARIAALESI